MVRGPPVDPAPGQRRHDSVADGFMGTGASAGGAHENVFGLILASLLLLAAPGAGSGAGMEVAGARAELGKRLFYDERLSGDVNFACATCHRPDKAFSDGKALSAAYTGAAHFRNTPTLANVGRRAAWMHDGRLGTNLNDVTRRMSPRPPHEHGHEADAGTPQAGPVYVGMFRAAGLGEPSNGGARRALAVFLDTIVSRGAPLDTGALSAAARRGQALFQGRAGCAACHSGRVSPTTSRTTPGSRTTRDLGRSAAALGVRGLRQVHGHRELHEPARGPRRLRAHAPAGDPPELPHPDPARAKWTAPYMHNGVFGSLEEVLDFYDAAAGTIRSRTRGSSPGPDGGREGRSPAFLEALSGRTFDTDDFVWRADDYDYKPFPTGGRHRTRSLSENVAWRPSTSLR